MNACKRRAGFERVGIAILIGIALIVVSFIGLFSFGSGGRTDSVAYAASGNWSDYADTSWFNTTDTVFVLDDTLDEFGEVVISAEAKLAGLAEKVNGGYRFTGKTIKLGRDVDLGAHYWTPIGIKADSSQFRGGFDGQNHTISNLTINNETAGEYYAGLFGYTRDTAMQNVTFVNAYVRSKITTSGTNGAAGGLIGWNNGSLYIDNVHFNGTVITVGNKNRAGGIVGYVNGLNEGDIIVLNSTNSGTINGGSAYAGGIVGSGEKAQDFVMINCSNSGSVTTSSRAGGLSGYACGEHTYIVNSSNTGSITSTNSGAAGIIGGHLRNLSVVNSFNTGTLSGKSGTSAVSGYRDSSSSGMSGLETEVTNFYYIEGSATYVTSGVTYTGSAAAVAEMTDEIIAELNEYVEDQPTYQVGETEYKLYEVDLSEEGEVVFSVTVKYEKGNPAVTGTMPERDAYAAGTVITLPSAGTFALRKYTFTGWSDGSNTYQPGNSYTLGQSDVTFTAQWAKAYWSDHADTSWYDGSGSYTLTTPAQLAGIATLVNSGTTTFSGETVYLNNDIDVGDYYWIPIGLNSSNKFAGTFDGQNHTISNMVIEDVDGNSGTGMFSYVSNATLSNFTLDGTCSITTSKNYVGGIVATSGGVSINNVHNAMSINSSGTVYLTVGGIIANPNGSASITDSSFTGTITVDGGGSIGGLVGLNYAQLTITDSYNSGTINVAGSDISVQIGGIVSSNNNIVTITNSYNEGTLSATSASIHDRGISIGGVLAENSSTVVVLGSYNTGTISAEKISGDGLISTGGIIGGNAYNLTLINSYNTGTVVATASDQNVRMGGIIGGEAYVAKFANSYNTGDISATTSGEIDVGGIAGYTYQAEIYNSYNAGTITTSGSSTCNAGGIVGKKETNASASLTIVGGYYIDEESQGVGNSADYAGTVQLSEEVMKAPSGSDDNMIDLLNKYVADNNGVVFDTYILSGWTVVGDAYISLAGTEATITYSLTAAQQWAAGSTPVTMLKTDIGRVITIATADKIELVDDPGNLKFFAWIDGSGNYYAPGAILTVTHSMTLTPVFVENTKCIVYYKADASVVQGNTPAPLCVDAHDPIHIAENTFIDNTRIFLGWAIESEIPPINVYLAGYTYEVTSDVVFVAYYNDGYPILEIADDIEGGALSVVYSDNYEEPEYINVNVNEGKIYVLEENRMLLITAYPSVNKELDSMSYRKVNVDGTASGTIWIPFEDDIGAINVEDGFEGKYELSASFRAKVADKPIVTVNQECWYGPVHSGGVTYENCSIVYIKIQLPDGADYTDMRLHLTLTRTAVWEAGKTKEHDINLTKDQFDADGYYTAGIAIRRRDLDNTAGVTADGYKMDATFYYREDGVDKSSVAAQGVMFACGKQSMEAIGGSTVIVDKFDGEKAVINLGERLATSGINRGAIKWTSSDTNVATVDGNGRVVISKQGKEVTITATVCENSISFTLKTMGMEFTGGEAEGVVLDQSGSSVILGPSLINTDGYTSDGTFEYSIDDTGVATVDAYGEITPVSTGMTYVTVTATLTKDAVNRDLSVRVPVYVRNTEVTTVEVSPASIGIGDTSTFTVTSSNGSVVRWVWSVISGTECLQNMIIGQGSATVVMTGREAGTAVVAVVGYNGLGNRIAAATQSIYVVDYKLNAYETGLINAGYIPITQDGGMISVLKYGASTPTSIQSVPFVSSATVSPNGIPNTDGISWFDYGGWYAYNLNYVMLEDITVGSTINPITSTVLPYVFYGALDGAGHKLTVHAAEIKGADNNNPAGVIFYKVETYETLGAIRNLKVTGTLSYEGSETKNAGFLAGTLNSTASLENVYINVKVSDGGDSGAWGNISALAGRCTATINNVIVNMENSTAGMAYVTAVPTALADTPSGTYGDSVTNFAVIGKYGTGKYAGASYWSTGGSVTFTPYWGSAGIKWERPWGPSDTWTTNYTSVWNWNEIFGL